MDKSPFTNLELNILKSIHQELISIAQGVCLSFDALCNAILIDYVLKYEHINSEQDNNDNNTIR